MVKVKGYSTKNGKAVRAHIRREVRKIHDYKEHSGKVYKTKSGQLWRGSLYNKRGAYIGPVHRSTRGWVKYMRKRR